MPVTDRRAASCDTATRQGPTPRRRSSSSNVPGAGRSLAGGGSQGLAVDPSPWRSQNDRIGWPARSAASWCPSDGTSVPPGPLGGVERRRRPRCRREDASREPRRLVDGLEQRAVSRPEEGLAACAAVGRDLLAEPRPPAAGELPDAQKAVVVLLRDEVVHLADAREPGARGEIVEDGERREVPALAVEVDGDRGRVRGEQPARLRGRRGLRRRRRRCFGRRRRGRGRGRCRGRRRGGRAGRRRGCRRR